MTDSDRHSVRSENGQATATAQRVTATDRHELVGEWLSPREAQVRLGISERTLYRRIGRGQLRKHDLDDGRIEVWVTVSSTDTDGHDFGRENGHRADTAPDLTDA